MVSSRQKLEKVKKNIHEHIRMLDGRWEEEMNAITVAAERLDEYNDWDDFLTKLIILEKRIAQFRVTEREVQAWKSYKQVILREVD